MDSQSSNWENLEPKLEWKDLGNNHYCAKLGGGLELYAIYESIQRLDPGEPRWNVFVFGRKIKGRMATLEQAKVRAEVVAFRYLTEARAKLSPKSLDLSDRKLYRD